MFSPVLLIHRSSFVVEQFMLCYYLCSILVHFCKYCWHSSRSIASVLIAVYADSVRINERKHRGVADNKKMAYLVDLKTIAISKWLLFSFLWVSHSNILAYYDLFQFCFFFIVILLCFNTVDWTKGKALLCKTYFHDNSRKFTFGNWPN